MASSTADRVDRLNGDNYRTWKFAIKMMLIQRELWSYVNGTATLNADANEIEKQNFQSKVDKALSTIALAVDPDQQIHIVDSKTAAEAWATLEQVYEPKSRQRIMQLKRQFVRIRLKDDETMASYLSRMKICSDYLQAAGSEIKDEDLAYAMLTGLPDSYDALTMSLANLEDAKFTSTEIKKVLLMEHERRLAKVEDNETKHEVVAYQVNKGNRSTFPKSNNIKKCFSCGKPGHYARDCRNSKKINVKKDSTNYKKNSFALMVSLQNIELEDAWLADSAATHHVCKHKEWFRNYRNIDPEPIGTADTYAKTEDRSLTAEGVGDVVLTSRIGVNKYDITLKDVYYVPRCRRNLMSVAQVEKKDKVFIFEKGIGRIIDKESGQTIVKARRVENLYVVQADVINPENEGKVKLHSTVMETGIWHQRFCHVNNHSIEELAQKGFVRGLENSKIDSNKCPGCCIGKSTKAPCRRLPHKQSHGILELIHSDLCGPMPVASIGGSKYFMTLVDDYSRKLHIYFLKSKDEVPNHIRNFVTKVERSKGIKLKRFRTDNGLEYCNRDLKGYFDESGIKHERSCVETPQMNGVAERVNRTLLDLVRSMLSSAKLPQSFWAEAVQTAAYVRNRTVHANLKDGVPEGIWTGNIPSVKHLKVFGCLAYAHLPAQGRKKLDPRARECIHVGYSSQTRGYRLWDPKRKEIIQTKHVRFAEDTVGYDWINGKQNHVYFEFPDKDSTQEKGNHLKFKDKSDSVTDIKTSTKSSISQVNADDADSDEYYSGCEDETVIQESRIVGESPSTVEVKRGPGRPKKKPPRNPYGCKGKPKEDVEINLLEMVEPKNLDEALSSPQASQWKNAIEEELSNLEEHKTWEITDLPKGKNCIGCKWIFKIKTDAEGKIARYKARLVAQGFSQEQGVDYNETYAPVARFNIIRFLLALAIIFGWTTRHVDVKCAYLNGHLDEDLYMELPSLYKEKKGKVARLLRPIYGLKQSGRNWNDTLNDFLTKNGFKRSLSSSCVYRLGFCTFLVAYVDDIIIFSRSENILEGIVDMLKKEYDIRDLGQASYFLGVMINRQPNGNLTLSQKAYILSMLKRYGMSECRPAVTPLEPGIKLTKDDSPKSILEKERMKEIPYKELIGSLMYVAQCTRPDIAYAVSKLSQFNSNPGQIHWIQAKRVLRYLSGTLEYGLQYTKGEPKIIFYSDADWGGDVDDRHSFSGMLTIIGENIVEWRASKQRALSTSTMEAEYIALSAIAKEANWTQTFMKELQLDEWLNTPYTVFCDNRAAIDFAKNRIENNRTKHIDIAFHNVREKIDEDVIQLHYVPTNENTSDILTKGLKRQAHSNCARRMNLCSTTGPKVGD